MQGPGSANGGSGSGGGSEKSGPPPGSQTPASGMQRMVVGGASEGMCRVVQRAELESESSGKKLNS